MILTCLSQLTYGLAAFIMASRACSVADAQSATDCSAITHNERYLVTMAIENGSKYIAFRRVLDAMTDDSPGAPHQRRIHARLDAYGALDAVKDSYRLLGYWVSQSRDNNCAPSTDLDADEKTVASVYFDVTDVNKFPPLSLSVHP